MSSIRHRLYHGETNIDFVGRRRVGFAISGALILISLLSLFTRGLNLGMDFEGGVAWELPVGEATVDGARVVMDDAGIPGASIQTLRGSEGERIRVRVGPQAIEVQRSVSQALADEAGVDVDQVSLNSVGPSWGQEVTDKAVRALVFFLLAIALYISLRFEWRMAVAALVAVVHDVLISVGIYSVFGFEVTPATVIAFLTILGFSLYDTIVVFDKVHENSRRIGSTGRATYSDVVNLSMNQVLMRSINTSLAAVLPVLSLLVVGSWMLGAVALEDFAIALLVGLVTGSYSSIFIATPILALLKEREPRYAALRKRAGATSPRAERAPALVGAAGESDAGVTEDEPATDAAAERAAAPRSGGGRPGATTTPIPPRPRKKKRR
ncbi:MAG: protein translocase subunit SecF [Acidimicrobiales bacterium]|nr:protein translocase subunit SecF [Acidimicrobiales bacterium]